MVDELNGRDNEERPENDDGDPEAPFFPESEAARTNEQYAQKYKNQPPKHENKALKMCFLILRWLWSVLGSSSFWTAAATVVIAAATILYTVYARRQWKEMSSATAVAKQSADAATKAAGIADQTLKDSEKQFKIQERAYIGVYSVVLESANLNDSIRAVVTLKNSGHSPALDVRYSLRATSGVPASTIEEMIEQFMKEVTYDDYQGVQPPDGNFPSRVPTRDNMNQREVAAFEDGTLPTFVYGRIYYRDIFGEDHHTGFCAKWDAKFKLFGFCPKHNHMD